MGFFDRPQIQQSPNPEPAGFDLLRDMLMRRSFEMNANPYGLDPNYQGPSPWQPNGRGAFNPYTGGYGMGGMGGGGMGGPGRQPMQIPPRQAGPPGGGGMGGGNVLAGGGGGGMMQPDQGGGTLAQLLQMLLARQGGGNVGAPTSTGRQPIQRGPTRPGTQGVQYDGECGYAGDETLQPPDPLPPTGSGGGVFGGPLPPISGGGGGPFGRGPIGGSPRRMRPRPGYDAYGPVAVGTGTGPGYFILPGSGGQGGGPSKAAPPPTTPPTGGGGAGGAATGGPGGPGGGSWQEPQRIPQATGGGGTPQTISRPTTGNVPTGGGNWWQSYPGWQSLPYPPGDPRNAGPSATTPGEPAGPHKPPGAYDGNRVNGFARAAAARRR